MRIEISYDIKFCNFLFLPKSAIYDEPCIKFFNIFIEPKSFNFINGNKKRVSF